MNDMQTWTDLLDKMQIYYYVTDGEIQIPQQAYTVPPEALIKPLGSAHETYITTGITHLQFTTAGTYVGSVFTITDKIIAGGQTCQ